MFPKELLEKLVNLSENGLVKLPEEVRVIKLLELTCQDTKPNIEQMLIKLELLGYLELNRSPAGNLISIRIKDEKWDPNRRLEPEPSYVPEPRRRFAIFMDYKNLEDSIRNPAERFRDFYWLLDPILELGEIIFAFVFIPGQLSSRPAIMQLSYRHSFFPVLCPRQIEGVVTKEKDTVDNRMISLGKEILEHSDCTDLVIVTGDGDFTELTNFAVWRRKQVQIISTQRSLSGDFLEGKRLKVRLLDE